MTWLLEERSGTLAVILVGTILVVLLGAGWAKTGRKELLYGLGAVVLLAILILALQRFVTTEGERALNTLFTIAKDVERNDIKAVVGHVHSKSPQIRARVEEEFPHYRFTEVKVTKVDAVEVDLDRVPPRAIIKFTVAVSGKDAEGYLDGTTVYRYVIVTMHKEGEAWRVQDFEHYDPQRAIMKD